MNSIRRTGGVPPVTAIIPTDRNDNDVLEDSIRKRPQHDQVAREYSEAAGGQQRLAEMAREPLPLNVQQAIESTRVTISDAGRQASRLDAQVLEEPPTDGHVKLYHQVQKLEPQR